MLFVTGKESDTVEILDPQSGKLLRTLGGPGKDLGQFRRPNGIAVIEDYLLVVERDNQRVQVLHLPDCRPIGSFGHDDLIKPYGLSLAPGEDGAWMIYITDDYSAPTGRGGKIDPQKLDGRIKVYSVKLQAEALQAQLKSKIGPADAAAALYKVESIQVDPDRNHLFVCEETEDCVKVYSLDGKYQGRLTSHWPAGHDTEGLALVNDPKAPAGGYLIVTEQGPKLTSFHIYSADGAQYFGAFTGDPLLANTDGICFSPGDLGPMRAGALFAVHDDKQVYGYSWQKILDVLHTHQLAAKQ